MNTAKNENHTKAAEALIKRILPSKAAQFEVIIGHIGEGSEDFFKIQSKRNKVVLKGNSPIAVASALHWYLKYVCGCHLSWNSDQLDLPDLLPVDFESIVRRTEFNIRAYLNYCTFSYSMPWWDWERWEREIDWMALHGINMPLAITGLEAVWQNTLRRLGMDDNSIRNFLVGPTYFAWQWMDNLEGWMGPLSQDWIDKHLELGKKIIARERELGMKTILKGFTGYVPTALTKFYPEAKIYKTDWISTFETAQIDPLDPLFTKIARIFVEEQHQLFGTDHYYSVDPFHESQPPIKTEEYLEQAGNAIFSAIKTVDPEAVLVIQTWSLRQGLLRAVPKDRTLMMALTGTNWKKHDSYWGRPWVVGMMHNFGGRNYLGGNLAHFLSHALRLKQLPAAQNVQGLGIFPEAIEHNPIVYEAATEIAWHRDVPDVSSWTKQYATARYGSLPTPAARAWEIMLSTVYQQKKVKIISMESPLCARPALYMPSASMNGDMVRDYNLIDLWSAWDGMLEAANELGAKRTFQYDLVDLARQCLADLSLLLHQGISTAYKCNDRIALPKAGGLFIELMQDIDDLLATREEFLLGKWLGDARKWGNHEEEENRYEQAARTLITVWGPVTPNALFFDYSNRQWSGLIKGFYIPRWKMFIDYLLEQPEDINKRYHERKLRKSYGRPANNANTFFESLSAWEKSWTEGHEKYSAIPVGDGIEMAKYVNAKWRPIMQDETKKVLPLVQQDDYLKEVIPQPDNFGL
ncbi:alpha-N-acetylglucosaminidase [Parapedobacter pyrenivorans]|uniref:Alpha-N-acetylglucosaminidase n=1 Tax=Parapedobacter pyrenivorans TaxID=1305674 RepID=A0A917HQ05_9SPHI|nr:alpha-N-acetylglucosaminidase [Parapedobacter pyrenivorans]GGG87009.1 alpha-N-acetylglucosaminidase [Parapedobacter pyrenivorans]